MNILKKIYHFLIPEPIRIQIWYMRRDLRVFFTYRILFPLCYLAAARTSRLNRRKAVFVEVRFTTRQDSFALIYDALEEKGYELHEQFIENTKPGRLAYFGRCIRMLWDIADARYVFLNDACKVTSCIPLRRGTDIIQLWHACGAFKRFGMSTADSLWGESRRRLEHYPNYGNLKYVTVSSPQVVWAYEEAMNLPHEPRQVVPTGISRTDVFYDEAFLSSAREAVRRAAPLTAGKKILLFAPTFRGHIREASSPDCLDIAAMKEALGSDYVLLIKHHPFVKNPPPVPEDCRDFAMDVTGCLPIDQLLVAADVCISDYSSLIFEYSLFERPMIFFAYDLEDYFDWRGFFYDYNELTPGPVVRTTDEIIDYIANLDTRFDGKEVRAFRKKFMSACDGRATDRILRLIRA